MKILYKTAYFLPIFIFIFIVNVTIDPALLFGNGKVEEEIAQHLLDGKNINSLYNYDERKVQTYWVEKLDKTPDITAVGSSRVMQIRKYFFNDNTFFINSGLSGATLEDMYGVIDLYEKHDKLPKKIVLGLDPWILNENNGELRWLPLKENYLNLANKVKVDASSYKVLASDIHFQLAKLKEAFSFSYFQESFKIIYSKKNIKYYEATVDSINEVADTKLTDGSRLYNGKQYYRKDRQVEQTTKSFIEKEEIRFLSNFVEVSSFYQSATIQLIHYLKLHNVEIQLVLHPYHPIAWDFLSQNPKYQNVIKAEKVFRNIATQTDTKISGSYNPYKLGVETSDFYDAYHLHPSAMQKLIQ